MKAMAEIPTPPETPPERTPERTPDQVEQELLAAERWIARLRSRQAALLAEADRMQLPAADGCRTLAEWTASRLDVAPETARDLVAVARSDREQIAERLASGDWSFDRTVASDRWVVAGASEDNVVTESPRFDVAGLRTQASLRRRPTPQDERQVFDGRFLLTQRSLDRSFGRILGQLPGSDMDLVEQNLTETADGFPDLPDGTRPRRAQRMADALVALTTGQAPPPHRNTSRPVEARVLTGHRDGSGTTTRTRTEAERPSSQPTTVSPRLPAGRGTLSVFVDAGAAHTSGGYTVGPSVLEELLCDALVEYTALAHDGRAVEAGGRRTVTDRQRRRIFHRDKTCGADGCTSRHRLEVHHRTFASRGGANDDDNLVLLCWFHHHIVIHRDGFSIDPHSPSGRLRFTKPPPPGPQRE